jgi:hypothetical protein
MAPDGTAEELCELAQLPAGAHESLWALLALALPEQIPTSLDGAIERFAAAHAVPEGRLVRALRACRLLLRQAARRNLSAADLAEDLAALAGSNEGDVQAILMPHYAAAMDLLRHEVRYGALTDHGKLLARVDWRVDLVKHADRGVEIEEPVVLVTLHLLDGDKRERVTFQALPDMLSELQTMCQQLLH